MSRAILVHSARRVDATGHVDDAWWLSQGDSVAAVGTGSAWREHARRLEEDAAVELEVVDARGAWLTPGFVDLHSHGAGGASFDGSPEDVDVGLATQRRHGTTRSVLSLVAAPVDALLTSLAAIADRAERDPLVLGAHLEGPFLAPGRRGAHDPAWLIEPDPAIVDELLGAGRDALVQLTIAPELPNALETVEILANAGVVVAVGHTEADHELARRAFDAGARMLTHAFNAMPGIGHRSPGPVVAALDDERVTLELVLDGRHVHPSVAALAFRLAGRRLAVITDAMAAAGAEDGRYRLGSLDVEVRDGLALVAGTETIAGSTLTMDRALAVGVEQCGLEPARVVEAMTLAPARAIGVGHRIGLAQPGFVADAVLLDSAWRPTHVIADGRLLTTP